jgi:hypothetical protein
MQSYGPEHRCILTVWPYVASHLMSLRFLLLQLMLLIPLLCAAQEEGAIEMEDSASQGVPVQFMYHPKHWSGEKDSTRYVLEGSPTLWYNGFDGLKFGVHAQGGRADLDHVFNARLWANSGLWQWGLPNNTDPYSFMPLAFMGDYRTSLRQIWNNSSIELGVRALEGLYGYQIGGSKQNQAGTLTLKLWYLAMYRSGQNGLPYLLNRETWDAGRWNSTINLSADYRYTYGSGAGQLKAHVRSGFVSPERDYHWLRIEALNQTEFWMLKLLSRVFIQAGFGSDWAPESMLYLDRASPEELMDNNITRSAGILPSQWAAYRPVQNHFHHGGGLNMRGYAGYLAPEVTEDGQVLAYRGMSGAAINLELEFDRVLGSDMWPLRKWLVLNSYLFADAGIMSINPQGTAPAFAMPRADAGLGLALTVKQWGPVARLKPFTVRFDMPFFVSRPSALEADHWRFRWVLGVQRAF